MLTRRRFVQSSLAFSAGQAFVNQGLMLKAKAFADTAPVAALKVLKGRPLAVVPKDFMGLGYEESSVAVPGLLEVSDATYVQLLRNLGVGVLRLGGIVADFTAYSPQGELAAEAKHTVVTQVRFERLREFLDAVDWKAIWSVNFGRGRLEEAVAEAVDVARILGPRLMAIELGNEVENYSRGAAPLRPPPYSYVEYRAEFTRWATALRAAVPGLRFAGPDTAASVEWVESMAADSRGDVQMLTTHYYRGDQKLGTREQLLRTDANLVTKLERLRKASESSGIPWRMCEINSFFGGGRPGVSDTLVGALWTLDTMLLHAQYGCAGMNIETGVNQLGFLSSYSPIRGLDASEVVAGAPYYGMLAFSQSVEDAREVLPVEFNSAGVNATAYALGRDGKARSFVFINKSTDRGFTVDLRSLEIKHGSVLRLHGPSLNSAAGVTLGGAAVDGAGNWRAQMTEVVERSLLVGPASAVVVRV